MPQTTAQVIVTRERRHQLRARNHRQRHGFGRRDGPLNSRANRQHQLRCACRGRICVIDNRKRQRAELARHLRRVDEIGTASGLRHHDEQGIMKIRRPPVGGDNRGSGGGGNHAQPHLEKIP